jgi:hypothetical protein
MSDAAAPAGETLEVTDFIGYDGPDQEPQDQPADAPPPDEAPEAAPETPAPDESGDTEAGSFPGYDPEEAFALDDEPAEEPDKDLEEDLKGASPRAQRRIQALSGRLTEATNELARAQSSHQAERQQVQQHFARLNQQHQQLREHYIALAARVEAGQAGPAKEREPIDEFRDSAVAEAVEKARSELDPVVKQALQRVEAMESQQREATQRAERQATIHRHSTDADSLVDTHFIPEGFPEDLKSQLRGPLGNMLIAQAYGARSSLQDAVPALNRFLRLYGLGLQKAHAATRGKRVAKSNNVTPPSPPGAAGKRGRNIPTKEQAEKAGHKDILGAMMAKSGLVGET